jgi:hypothetical protein
MPTEQIVALLIAERDKLNRAIEALQGSIKRRGRPPGQGKATASSVAATSTSKSVRSKRMLSTAGRKAIADAARKRWAAIKAGKAPSPFAKSSAKKAKA